VVFIVLWVVKRKQRKKEQERILKRQMFDIRMKEMTRQFDPHFAFNVLNTLGMFILVGKPELAHKNLVRFSALLRKTITGYGKILIPLSDEVEFITEYCALQDTLHNGKFSYSIPEIPDGLKDFRVPRMIIHSFVENSLKHCVKPRKSGGTVSLSYESNEQYLIVRITDKAKDPSEVISQKTSGTGQGTKLTNHMFELLSTYYQKNYSYEMQPLLEGEISYGMTVEVRIPIVLESDSLV
jgi:LytS/YehU family sensor histidine kinase